MKRMVVEEINTPVEGKAPLEEVKEKVGELQDITKHMSNDVKASAEVQEEIVEAAEKVESPIITQEPVKQNGVNPLVVIIPGVLLLGALLGGIYFYQSTVNRNAEVSQTPSPTVPPPVVATPSASPSAQVNLAKYSVVILNGSGISGEAGKVKDLLVKAGFRVTSTGNAATYDFKKTVIKAKSTIDATYLAKLSETLSKTYVLDTNQTLPDSSKDSVEVIVGTSKN